MPESISTSSRLPIAARAARAAALGFALALLPLSLARADSRDQDKGKIFQPEEEDFSNTPFTEYGEFNEEEEEEADAKFFAHGRFFGVSLGIGYEGATGNLGTLWQGGFPMVDGKLHYWFDFNFAVDMDFYFASHYYTTTASNGGNVTVAILHAGIDAKYYFDTKNLSSAISFANPYLQVGFGAYTQTISSFTQSTTQAPDTEIGMSLGAGLEFAVSPKKVYVEFEGRYHIVNWANQYTTLFAPQIPNLTGGMYTFSANILFTW